jgi:haloalkane dehalogenase
MKPIAQHLYPFEGRRIDLGGYRMHYLDEGDGPPVVMVHGNPTWSFYFRNLVLALRDHHRCIVPDHIGCGLSDVPDESDYSYRLDQRVADLGTVLEGLALDSLDLVVHDWGGMIGLTWATRHPELVRRIVVLNTGAFHLPPAKKVPWQLRLVRNSGLGVFLVRRFNAFARGAAYLATTRSRLSPEVRDAYCAPYDSWHNRLATARFVQDIPLAPDDPGYQTVTDTESRLQVFADHKVLICWGEKDFVFDRHFRETFEGIWPQAEVHRFEDAGHYVLEDAAEEVIPLVQEFLA